MEAASVNVTNKHKFYLCCFHIFFIKGQWSPSEQRRDDAAISCDWNDEDAYNIKEQDGCVSGQAKDRETQ